MTLFRDGQEIASDWHRVSADEALPQTGAVILTKGRYIAERDVLRGRNAPLGVVLSSGETIDGIEDDLARLSLVVLEIGRYADGRLYSIARLLRERFRYTGEIRASGDVLRDQIMLLHRVGVDSFDVSHPDTIAALQQRTIVAPVNHTQVAAQAETRGAGWSWRRVSPARSVPGLKA